MFSRTNVVIVGIADEGQVSGGSDTVIAVLVLASAVDPDAQHGIGRGVILCKVIECLLIDPGAGDAEHAQCAEGFGVFESSKAIFSAHMAPRERPPIPLQLRSVQVL